MARKKGVGPASAVTDSEARKAASGSPSSKPSTEPNQLSWRDVLPVHPAAELLPRLPIDELRELAEDIKANGLQHRAMIWRAPDGAIVLLDGRNRLDALELAFGPIGQIIAETQKSAATVGAGAYSTAAVEGQRLFYGAQTQDPYDYVLSANLHRRHLATAQRIELLENILKADPTMSARRAAKLAKVSPTTGTKARARLEERGDVSAVDTSIDTLGRSQPRKKKKHERSPQAEWSSPRPEEEEPARETERITAERTVETRGEPVNLINNDAPTKREMVNLSSVVPAKIETSHTANRGAQYVQAKSLPPRLTTLDELVATIEDIVTEARAKPKAFDPAQLLKFFDDLQHIAAEGLGLPQCIDAAEAQAAAKEETGR